MFGMFDIAAYLNRDDRADRRAETEAALSEIGLNANRVPAKMFSDRGMFPSPAYRSNFDGHMGIIQHASDTGAKSVLVLEDDIEFIQADRPEIAEMIDGDNWDMLFFHSTNGGQVVAPGVMRINGTLLAHAYAIHNRAYSRVLDAMARNTRHPLDLLYSRHLCRTLATYAAASDMTRQRKSRSDITRHRPNAAGPSRKRT